MVCFEVYWARLPCTRCQVVAAVAVINTVRPCDFMKVSLTCLCVRVGKNVRRHCLTQPSAPSPP